LSEINLRWLFLWYYNLNILIFIYYKKMKLSNIEWLKI
jgi:hypothetical protein